MAGKSNRFDELVKSLRSTRKRLRSRDSIIAVESAIYELEHGFNPADGIWLVEMDGSSKRRFVKIGELPTLDMETLAKLETRRMDAAEALEEAVECTKKNLPGGETWWTYAPGDIIDAIFRALAKEKSGKGEF